MPTCSDCASGTCPNQLLPDILNGKYLTSGYMGLFSPEKPQGEETNQDTDEHTYCKKFKLNSKLLSNLNLQS